MSGPGPIGVMSQQDELRARLDRLHARAIDHLFVSYLGLWKREDPRGAAETTTVAGCLVAAMVDVAARVAQDLGMTSEQLQAITRESFDRALAGAPKWG
jgi:hypothetical protein